MKATKQDKMYERIEKHGKDLIRIFGLSIGTDPIKLCKKLRRLEVKAHRIATDYCNGVIDSEQAEDYELDIIDDVGDILFQGKIPDVPVFMNFDARGYALKIDQKWLYKKGYDLYRDWGGYGIIAPDLSQD